jgi:hypothetical protein
MERFESPRKGDILYYTDGFISNPRTLSIVTILYDRVFTYYLDPNYYATKIEEGFEKLKGMGIALHKKNLQTSEVTEEDTWAMFHQQTASTHLKKSVLQFWQDNSLLRSEGVLLPIGRQIKPKDRTSPEDFLESEIGMNFFRASDWARSQWLVPPGKSYFDVGFFHIHRLTQASTGLHFALTLGMIPFADHPVLASIASSLVCDAIPRESQIQPLAAAMLANQTICHLVPNFGCLQPEEILEVRHKTKDERGIFTNSMDRLAFSVPLDTNMDDIRYEVNKIVRTDLEPALIDLQNNIKAQKKELFRKLALEITAEAAGIPVLMQQLSTSPETTFLASMGFAIKGLVDIHNYQSKIEEERRKTSSFGLGFVLDLMNKAGKISQNDYLPCGILPRYYK